VSGRRFEAAERVRGLAGAGGLGQFAKYRREQKAPSADVPTQVFDFEPGLKALALTKPKQDATLALQAASPGPGHPHPINRLT
jgi:hypothetical protein